MNDSTIFGEVISNDFGIVTINILHDVLTFCKDETIMIKGRHKFPVGSLVGISFNGIHVKRTLALVG